EWPVRWAWERFQRSSDAEALTPDEQAIASLRAWIAERWDVTIKSVDSGADGFDRKLNNREAVAWYDEAAIYVPAQRLREASGATRCAGSRRSAASMPMHSSAPSSDAARRGSTATATEAPHDRRCSGQGG